MFGYVRPYKAEMLVREYEQYKSVYCGLCRFMGKAYGPLARLTLSYDCTFYALLLLSLQQEQLCFERKKCVVNPLKKCTYCTTAEIPWKKASALSVILTYQKLKDDVADGGFWKAAVSRFLLIFVSTWRKKAKKLYPRLDKSAECFIENQRTAETAEEFSFDQCAEPTAQFLAELFSQDFSKEQSRILHELGYYMGRWVYLIDAADDLKKDLQQKSFNPYVHLFALTKESYEKSNEEVHIKCNEILNFSLSQAVSAMQLLPFCTMGPIVENIVAKGLPQMQKEILFMEKKGKENVRSI